MLTYHYDFTNSYWRSSQKSFWCHYFPLSLLWLRNVLANRVKNLCGTISTCAGLLLYKVARTRYFETNMTVQYLTLLALKQQLGRPRPANGQSKWRAHSTLTNDVQQFENVYLCWDWLHFRVNTEKGHFWIEWTFFGAIFSHCRCCRYGRCWPIVSNMEEAEH